MLFISILAAMLIAIPTDTANAEAIDAARQTFKDVIATTGNFSNGAIKGHAELRTVNEKENSLSTLTRYFGSMQELMKNLKSMNPNADEDVNGMPGRGMEMDEMESGE